MPNGSMTGVTALPATHGNFNLLKIDFMNTSLTLLPPGAVTLRGVLGNALNQTVANRLKKLDYRQMVDPFRYRNEADNRWRCEFWGKVVRSAVYAWRGTQDAELKKMLTDTVADLLSTQTPDGCISSYPVEKQLGGWDIWGRKYVLTALMAYYQEIDPDPQILQKMLRAAHQLLDAVPVIPDMGEHYGLAASSILRVFNELQLATGDKRLRDTVDYLVERGCCLHDVFHMAHIGVSPAELSNGKAYEMTSCFQGLVSVCADRKDPLMREIAEKYYRSVRDQEIFITGGGGLKDVSGEFWFNGKKRQANADCGGVGETCITVSWLGFCLELLKLSGDTSIADEMERSLYNALLGAVADNGANFIHVNPTLSGGWKRPSGNQMPDFAGHDCCRAQGPYGLAIAPMLAVMKSPDGYLVNLYDDMNVDGVLEINGNFPVSDTAEITVFKEGEYELALRIPAEYGCRVNGKTVPAGKVYRLKKNWTKGEKIALEFDFSVRKAELTPYHAFVTGPLVLCREENGTGEPVLRRAGELVDYASAGKRFSPENTLAVWLKD